MKEYRYLFLVLLVLIPLHCGAEDLLGAPVLLQAQQAQKSDVRLELKTTLSHDEVALFYRNALKEPQDIRFRAWKDSTYIEDDGNLGWYSITIEKGKPGKEIRVVILKDNWTWIIGTLILRFIGVFFVLLIVLAGMYFSGLIISRYLGKADVGKSV